MDPIIDHPIFKEIKALIEKRKNKSLDTPLAAAPEVVKEKTSLDTIRKNIFGARKKKNV
jgi:hypothetical protein